MKVLKMKNKKAELPGWIYIIGNPSKAMGVITGQFKIGIAADVEVRLKTLQASCPSRLEIVFKGHCKYKSPLDLEREIHKLYADCRIHGEWFLLAEKNIEDIKLHIQRFGEGKKIESPEDLMSELEVADYLRQKPRTIRAWRQRLGLPCFKPTHKESLFRRSDVDIWLDRTRLALTPRANARIGEL